MAPAPYARPPGPPTPKAPAGPKTIPLGAQPGQKGWKARTEARWAKNNPDIIAAAKARQSARAPGTVTPAAPAAQTPNDAAMATFRSTLDQLNQLSPEVNATAIRAPYEASKTATQQLGAGWAAQEGLQGQQAQDEYGKATGAAQQRATSFGISAGAGQPAVDATAINTEPGSLMLAQQTQANQAAATAAATAWQGLLERTAGAAVSKAQSDRQGVIDSGKQQLTLALPGMVQNEKQNQLASKTEKDNLGALYSQLTEKQRASLTDEQLRLYGINKTASTAAAGRAVTTAGQKSAAATAAAKLASTDRHNRATEAATTAKQKAAAKAGVKGLKDVMALNPKAGSGNSPHGWDQLYTPLAPDGTVAGPPKPQHVPRLDIKIKGMRVATPGKGTVHLSKGPSGAASTNFDWGTYKRQIQILIGSNPQWNNGKPMTAAQAAGYLTPTPSSKKK